MTKFATTRVKIYKLWGGMIAALICFACDHVSFSMLLSISSLHTHHLKCLWDGKSIFGNQTLIRQIEIGKIHFPTKELAKLGRFDNWILLWWEFILGYCDKLLSLCHCQNILLYLRQKIALHKYMKQKGHAPKPLWTKKWSGDPFGQKFGPAKNLYVGLCDY